MCRRPIEIAAKDALTCRTGVPPIVAKHKKANGRKKEPLTESAGGPADPAMVSTEQQHQSPLSDQVYRAELGRLQIELVKLLESVKRKQLKVCVLFEGRDAAGKGGTIQRISRHLNPRFCRVVALGTPTERECRQWYFQRYVAELPAAGEIVLFDRSWYNRAGVEHVMGFCTQDEYQQFLRDCPDFERLLIRSGMILIKYWFSVSPEEQERRFRERIKDPLRRWKLSAMDLEARARDIEFSQAKDVMFEHTDVDVSPWYVVEADDKCRARLNCINHLLSLISYSDIMPTVAELPPRQEDNGYERPPISSQRFVPSVY